MKNGEVLNRTQKERYLRELQEMYGETKHLSEILQHEIHCEKQKKQYLEQLRKKYGGAFRLKEIIKCEIL